MADVYGSSSLHNFGFRICFLVCKLHQKTVGYVLTTKIVSIKICGINAKMSSLELKLIFIQVWHVYALCRTWGLFMNISNIICKEIQRCTKTSSKMGQTTDLNAPG
jgi:hypothetical protein